MKWRIQGGGWRTEHRVKLGLERRVEKAELSVEWRVVRTVQRKVKLKVVKWSAEMDWRVECGVSALESRV